MNRILFILLLVVPVLLQARGKELSDLPRDDGGYLQLLTKVAPLPMKSRSPLSRRSFNYYADPEILHDGKLYFLFATSSDSTRIGRVTTSGLGIRCFSSPDLKTWRDRGLALNARDSAACSYTQNTIWAPQAIRGPDKAYYLFYNASGPEFEKERKGFWAPDSSFQRLCVARSEKPAGPYVEYAAPLLDGKEIPGYVDGKSGIIGCIDAYCFADRGADGKTLYYLYWSGINDTQNQNLLWGGELREDLRGLKLPPDGPEPKILIGEPMQDWETKACGERRIVEAASVIRRGDTYYLLYSANSFNTPEYSIGYATAKNPLGPFTRAEHNPVVHSPPDFAERLGDRSTWIGPGGGSFLTRRDGTTREIVFHSIDNQTTIPRCDNTAGWFRNIRIAPLRFDGDGTMHVKQP